jgi:hypothetical protein
MYPTFDDHSGVKPLAFQARGISSMVLVPSHARKNMRMELSKRLSLFWTHKGYTKKEPPRVVIKIFSDSLNMKILSSDLASFPTH